MGAVAGMIRFFWRSFSQFTLSLLSRSLEQATIKLTMWSEYTLPQCMYMKSRENVASILFAHLSGCILRG